MFDTLIVGAQVVDGTGNPWFLADIGLIQGRIGAVGRLRHPSGRRVIDADGLVAAPGFIDAHTHSDFSLFMNPGGQSQIGQGITTEIDGNCGYSAFPRFPQNRQMTFDPEGVEAPWSSAEEYFAQLTARGPAVNCAFLVGHNTVRAAVMGIEENRSSATDMDRMKALVRDAMGAGAIGLSTGLEYPPGSFADLEELVGLSRVVADYGGIHASHIRNSRKQMLSAVQELLDVGSQSSAAVHVAHYGFSGLDNCGLNVRGLEIIDDARAQGVDVSLDMIPYRTSGAWWGPRAVFPQWAYDWKKDNLEELLRLLTNSSERTHLKEAVEAHRTSPKVGFDAELVFAEWAEIYIESVGKDSPNQSFVGLSIPDIAARRGLEPVDAYFDLLLDEGRNLSSIRYPTSEEDFYTVLMNPMTMFCTDSVATSLEMQTAPFNVLQAHPRHYSTFPHVLGQYVFREKKLSLEDTVRRMTSLPAQRFGIQDRGLLRVGMAADLVLFDPRRIGARSTFMQPKQYPAGIEYVIVNGELSLEGGEITGKRAGQILRRRN